QIFFAFLDASSCWAGRLAAILSPRTVDIGVENPQFRSRARVKEYVNSIRSHILVEFGSQRRRNGEEMQRCVNLYISVRGDRACQASDGQVASPFFESAERRVIGSSVHSTAI